MGNLQAVKPAAQTRMMPCNPEAERAVLGSILLDTANVHVALSKLTPEDFYDQRHSLIFKAMAALTEKSAVIDYISVKNELEKGNLLPNAGGIAYLTSLTEGIPRAMNIDSYVDMVLEKSTVRRLIQVSTDAAKKGFAGEQDSDELLEEVQRELWGIESSQRRGEFVAALDAVTMAYKNLEARSEGKIEITGVPAGFEKLDKLTRGFKPGEFVLIAARPGCGKTTILLNIGAHAGIRAKKTVAVFSMEMSIEQLVNKVICAEAGISIHNYETGKLVKEDWPKVQEAAAALSGARIFFNELPELTVTALRSMAHRLKAKEGLDLLIVDYLQLLSAGERVESRFQEISLISRKLKVLARELNIPVVVASQLNRAIEHKKRKPELSDLRESGSLEQDADMVGFLHRDEEDEQAEKAAGTDIGGPVEFILRKNRNGATGTVEMVFAKTIARFYPMQKCEF